MNCVPTFRSDDANPAGCSEPGECLKWILPIFLQLLKQLWAWPICSAPRVSCPRSMFLPTVTVFSLSQSPSTFSSGLRNRLTRPYSKCTVQCQPAGNTVQGPWPPPTPAPLLKLLLVWPLSNSMGSTCQTPWAPHQGCVLHHMDSAFSCFYIFTQIFPFWIK